MKKILSLFVLEYLKFFAKLKLAQIKPIIIGIAGSAGKSSCVAAIEAVLKTKYSVKTTGTANSESGIPLSILDLKISEYSLLEWLKVMLLAPLQVFKFEIRNSKFEILVCEMGIDSLVAPKNMDYLLSIVQPKIGVFLNALPVHTLQMGNVKNIFNEKSKLIKSLPADGYAVINANLPQITTQAKVIKFKDDGSPIPPALAVGKIFGINKMPKFDLPPGRWSVFEGINGSIIIDSSYNSSPVPTIQALKKLKEFSTKKLPFPEAFSLRGQFTLATNNRGFSLSKLFMFVKSLKWRRARELNPDSCEPSDCWSPSATMRSPSNHSFSITRRIAVLGDMRELGNLAENEHKKVVTVAKKFADEIITVGSLWKQFAKFPHQFDNWYQAGKFLQTYIKPRDVILFKGSQNTIFLEGAVEMVLKNKSDVSKLCRRGKYWEGQREKCFRFDTNKMERS